MRKRNRLIAIGLAGAIASLPAATLTPEAKSWANKSWANAPLTSKSWASQSRILNYCTAYIKITDSDITKVYEDGTGAAKLTWVGGPLYGNGEQVTADWTTKLSFPPIWRDAKCRVIAKDFGVNP